MQASIQQRRCIYIQQRRCIYTTKTLLDAVTTKTLLLQRRCYLGQYPINTVWPEKAAARPVASTTLSPLDPQLVSLQLLKILQFVQSVSQPHMRWGGSIIDNVSDKNEKLIKFGNSNNLKK